MAMHFKPASSALVLIDYQLGTLRLARTTAPDLALRNAVNLAKAAKVFGMPMVMTSSQEDRIQGPVAPVFERVAPAAFAARIKRARMVNAWDDPAFLDAVKATGRRQLIMAGITTDICLVFPSISATEAGFEVQAVMDASGSPSDVAEDMARRRMERAGVVLTTTNTMIAELVSDWRSSEGQQLVPLLMASAPMQPVD